MLSTDSFEHDLKIIRNGYENKSKLQTNIGEASGKYARYFAFSLIQSYKI